MVKEDMHLSQELGATNPKEEGTPHRDPTPHRVPTPHKVPTPLKEGIKGVHLQPGVTPGQDSHHHPGDTQGHHQVAPIKVEDLHLQGHTHRKEELPLRRVQCPSFRGRCPTRT